jgi:hypothetical protein
MFLSWRAFALVCGHCAVLFALQSGGEFGVQVQAREAVRRMLEAWSHTHFACRKLSLYRGFRYISTAQIQEENVHVVIDVSH